MYSVFGLRVESEIPIPELFPANRAEGAADVTIRLGSNPLAETMPTGVHDVTGGALLKVEDVGSYLVTGGNRIIVDPQAAVPAQNLRLYLLGSAFGILLHQRGLLPLHANAIEIDGRAFAFMGESGAGKSTLAAWFHDRGHRIIADDVCVIRFDDGGRPLAIPGLPRLRLWREILEATGRDAESYPRSFEHADQPEKYDVPVAHSLTASQPIELAAIYLLARDGEFRIDPLTGVAAAEGVFANTYRGGYLQSVGCPVNHWESSVRLVRRVSVFSAARLWGLKDLDWQSQSLLDHARSIPLQS